MYAFGMKWAPFKWQRTRPTDRSFPLKILKNTKRRSPNDVPFLLIVPIWCDMTQGHQEPQFRMQGCRLLPCMKVPGVSYTANELPRPPVFETYSEIHRPSVRQGPGSLMVTWHMWMSRQAVFFFFSPESHLFNKLSKDPLMRCNLWGPPVLGWAAQLCGAFFQW